MATTAHCAYCFECLSGSLEKRKPLSLQQVEILWNQYESSCDNEAEQVDEEMAAPPSTEAYKPAAISRLLNTSGDASSSTSSSSAPSASSSTPSLATTSSSSAASKSSSRTSLFSLPKRLSRGGKKEEKEVEAYPLFITWNTVSSRGRVSLRGCIGTFEAQELEDGLRDYALTSAFEDIRFNPISASELPHLECSVTLLTNFEPIPDPMDWEIGTHGLRISFIYNNRRYGSTYLPDVAREQGWTKEETMVSLMRKAGWNGRGAEWRGVRELKVIRYQGYRENLGWKEWTGWRDWVVETGRDGED